MKQPEQVAHSIYDIVCKQTYHKNFCPWETKNNDTDKLCKRDTTAKDENRTKVRIPWQLYIFFNIYHI